MTLIAKVCISDTMIEAVRSALADDTGFIPVEWRAHPNAIESWENQALRALASIVESQIPGHELSENRHLTIGGLPVKSNISIVPDGLYLYGEFPF